MCRCYNHLRSSQSRNTATKSPRCAPQTNDTGRASALWRYGVSGKGIGPGALVYEETDPAMSLAVWRVRDGQYMVLQGASDSASYVKVLDTANLAGAVLTSSSVSRARKRYTSSIPSCSFAATTGVRPFEHHCATCWRCTKPASFLMHKCGLVLLAGM